MLRTVLTICLLLPLACQALGAPAPTLHPRVSFFRPPREPAEGAVVSDWPRFLGPEGTGVSPETRLVDRLEQPREGEPDPMLVWSLLKGESYTAPSIQDGRLICFHRIRDREIVECLDAETGRLHWTTDYPTTYRDRYRYLNGPRATPAIDGDRVYTLGAQGVLQCLDLRTGQVHWRRKLANEFKLDQGFFGFSTSPLIEGDRVILNLGLGKCVAAFNKHTGELDWISGDQWGRSYASPVAATIHGKRTLFVFAGGMTDPPIGGLLCLNPESGEIHFRLPWRSKRKFSANAANPVISGNRVFISSSYDVEGVTLAIKEDMTYEIAYESRACSSHWTTPILHDGYLYGFANNKLSCMDWSTGERMWHQRLMLSAPQSEDRMLPPGQRRGGDQYREPPGSSGFGFGSLIRVDDRFLALGETGLLAWLDLTPEGCRILSARRLFNAKQTWTAPVVSKGLLYVMQNQPGEKHPPRLLCFDLRAGR